MLLFHFSPIYACISRGVLAYYWSQFDIPASDLEMVPEVSEERVLDALEAGIKHSRSISPRTIKISEVTAASKYHQGHVVTGRGITPERARKTTWHLLQLAFRILHLTISKVKGLWIQI